MIHTLLDEADALREGFTRRLDTCFGQRAEVFEDRSPTYGLKDLRRLRSKLEERRANPVLLALTEEDGNIATFITFDVEDHQSQVLEKISPDEDGMDTAVDHAVNDADEKLRHLGSKAEPDVRRLEACLRQIARNPW